MYYIILFIEFICIQINSLFRVANTKVVFAFTLIKYIYSLQVTKIKQTFNMDVTILKSLRTGLENIQVMRSEIQT